MATVVGGITSATNSIPLLLILIYDVFFLRDGSHANQNIQGYFLCLSIATIVIHVIGVVVFGLPTVDQSDYIPFGDTEHTRGSNGNSNMTDTVEPRPVTELNLSQGICDNADTAPHDYSPAEMLKSPRYTPLVLGTGLLKKFNFLGLQLNENMSWKPHIDLLSNKLAKCAGVLNKLKRVLPVHILRTLYFSMVQSRMMYCILTWGFDYYRIEKLQKRFVRIISSSKYNAHSEPLFKVLDILKIEHLFSQSCLKFVYKFKKSQLPKYFLSFQCVPRSPIHDHDTRDAEQVDTIYTRTHMAAKCIRSHLPVILNDTPDMIINKINTHSIQGFSFFIKRYYLSQYTTQCQLRGCFTCNN